MLNPPAISGLNSVKHLLGARDILSTDKLNSMNIVKRLEHLEPLEPLKRCLTEEKLPWTSCRPVRWCL